MKGWETKMTWGAQCAAACCTNRTTDPGGLCMHCEIRRLNREHEASRAAALREADARLALLASAVLLLVWLFAAQRGVADAERTSDNETT